MTSPILSANTVQSFVLLRLIFLVCCGSTHTTSLSLQQKTSVPTNAPSLSSSSILAGCAGWYSILQSMLFTTFNSTNIVIGACFLLIRQRSGMPTSVARSRLNDLKLGMDFTLELNFDSFMAHKK